MKPKITAQMKNWNDEFGINYTDRNTYTPSQMDEIYKKQYGVTRTEMNKEFILPIKKEVEKVLEVGCNIGIQLALLQSLGFKNLYGIECQQYAVKIAKKIRKDINIIRSSALDIPFKDGYFDLVFTNVVLIHMAPKDITLVLEEIYRCSKKYIWGFEYFAPKYTEINYRGHSNMLWKTNFCRLYLERFNNLERIKEKKYKYTDNDNIDSMFLLKKKNSK